MALLVEVEYDKIFSAKTMASLKGKSGESLRQMLGNKDLMQTLVRSQALLGEIIDDPSKKKDCYNQVLKLSPNNPLALHGLRNLEVSKVIFPENSTVKPDNTQPTRLPKSNSNITAEQTQGLQDDFNHHANASPSQSVSASNDDWKTGVYGILGLVAFFGISYIIGFMGSDDGTSNICSGMICLVMIIGLFALYARSQYRDKVINNAIQEQKQSPSSSPSENSSYQSNIVSCRACQHTVSRTAPSCPNCGELYPGLISKCPNCNSRNIRITPKGFSLGKAAAGAAMAGPVGVAGGLHGRKDLELRCSSCQLVLTIKHDEIK